MPLYFNDFSQYAVGPNPLGWVLSGPPATSLSVIEEGGNRLLRVSNPGGGGPGSLNGRWLWTSNGNPVSVANEVVEVVARFRRSVKSTLTAQWATVLRDAGGSANSVIGALGVLPDRFLVLNGGTPVGAGAALAWSANEWLWIRTRVIGASQIQERAWPDGTVQPSNWPIDVISAGLSSSGYVGVGHSFSLSIAQHIDFAVIGVAVGGGTAPMGLPAIPAFITPLAGELLSSPVIVTWSQSPEADLYRLDYSTDGGASWSTLTEQIGTLFNWNVELLRGATVHLRVRASQGGLAGNWSSSLVVKVDPWSNCLTPPTTIWTIHD